MSASIHKATRYLGSALLASALVAAMAATGSAQPTAEEPTRPATTETLDHQAGSGDTDVGRTGGGTADNSHAHPSQAHAKDDAHGHHDPSKHFNFFGFGYRGKDVMGGPLGDGKMVDAHSGEVTDGEEAMSPPFVLMIVNFVILLGLLAWKGGPVFRKLAADRHDAIKTALEEAAKLRQQAADKLAEYETRLKDADAEIKKLVEGMRTDAEADKKRILAAAETQAAAMKRDAEQRIAAELEYARAALTREVTAAATAATEKLLREKLQPADQQRLVSSFIADVHQASASSRSI